MAEYLPQKPVAIPLIAALAANSHFLYGNIGVMTAGIIPYVLNNSSPPSETVKATNWFIIRGKDVFLWPAIASSALFASTAFYAAEPRVQRLGAVAAASMFGIVPWTVLALVPINKWLEGMAKGGAKALEGKEEEAVGKVRSWRARHMVRIVLATVGWVAGVAALEIL